MRQRISVQKVLSKLKESRRSCSLTDFVSLRTSLTLPFSQIISGFNHSDVETVITSSDSELLKKVSSIQTTKGVMFGNLISECIRNVFHISEDNMGIPGFLQAQIIGWPLSKLASKQCISVVSISIQYNSLHLQLLKE